MQSVTGDNFASDVVTDNVDAKQQTIVKDAIDETMSRTSPVEDAVFKVVRRNGKVTPYDNSKIEVALTKAFLSVEGGTAAASSRIHDTVKKLATQVSESLFRRMPDGGIVKTAPKLVQKSAKQQKAKAKLKNLKLISPYQMGTPNH